MVLEVLALLVLEAVMASSPRLPLGAGDRSRYTRFRGMRRIVVVVAIGTVSALGSAFVMAQGGPLILDRNHPAIEYSTRETHDPVALLNQKIRSGEVRLAFDGPGGYLRSLLTALDVPIESQTLVYSETSFQAQHITYKTPRALYFNDTVAVGWVQGGETLELTAQDPEQGVVFWTLPQARADKPQFGRDSRCFACHLSPDTNGV